MSTYSRYSDYLRTPEFAAVRQLVRDRSGGLCERCGDTATEPHHVKYCKWGEFDSPENLIDMCNRCHCNAHRCESCGRVNLKARHIKRGQKRCDDCR